MERDPPSKPSVAELAGRFKGHAVPMPNSKEEVPVRRRPPSSLKLQRQKDDNEESDKPDVSPNPFKVKTRNSAIIEKLQANLSLSPTALLPSPKSPEVKLPPASLSPETPCSPMSPLSPTPQPTQQPGEEEEPVSFEDPPEGNTLPNINKTRPRLSVKRRPPSRKHRQSASEDDGPSEDLPTSCELHSPGDSGHRHQAANTPAQAAEPGQPGGTNDTDQGDSEKTEEEGGQSPDCRPEQQEERRLSESDPAEEAEGNVADEQQ